LDIERRIALYALELTEKSWECFGEAAQSRALYPRFERLAEAVEAEAREIQEKLNAASWGESY
jgi:hypothetical protein